jgi:uncharacterized protein YndB with AHSA1/START domain
VNVLDQSQQPRLGEPWESPVTSGRAVACAVRAERSTRITRFIAAPRSRIYAALLDPEAVARWKVPAGMSCSVEAFDARVGGRIRLSLTYDSTDGVGKTSAQTDTYVGTFVELVPDERVVEIDEFVTTDDALRGEMRATITLADRENGTDVVGLHEGIPAGVSLADNEAGWASALARLAALVE